MIHDRLISLLYNLACICALTAAYEPLEVSNEFKCGLAHLADQFANTLIGPEKVKGSVFISAGGHKYCPDTYRVEYVELGSGLKKDHHHVRASFVISVSKEYPDTCHMNRCGNLQAAVDLIRKLRADKRSPTFTIKVLSDLVLTEPVQIGAQDSDLIIEGVPFYDGSSQRLPYISGAVSIQAEWSEYKRTPTLRFIATRLPELTQEALAVFADGRPLTRARFPNCLYHKPESSDCRISGDKAHWYPPHPHVTTTEFLEDPTLSRKDHFMFEHWKIGKGGECEIFEPPVSYWCSADPEGGAARRFVLPGGFKTNHSGLNLPYANDSEIIANIWRPYRWENWIFRKAQEDKTDLESNRPQDLLFRMTFGAGGFQGARGATEGGDFFIENVEEELDSIDEFFYDSSHGTFKVVLSANDSYPSAISIPQTGTLINISHSHNVTISLISFRHTKPTYFDPHSVPSGGDWALERSAAIIIEGSEEISIADSIFDFVGGNGVLVSGNNDNVQILRNEFSYVGSTAIVVWGKTDTEDNGFLLRGYYPSRTLIEQNMVRNVGLYSKQNSFIFQALACSTTIRANVLFDGPRAGININDGFCGGTVIERNLVMSTCRESSDHGTINTWDRQVYGWKHDKDDQSELTTTPSWNHIRNNLLIANFQANGGLDTDDGSQFYNATGNVFIYGDYGLKGDFNGQDVIHAGNLYTYVNLGLSASGSHERITRPDIFRNNVLILTQNGSYAEYNQDGLFELSNNTIFTKDESKIQVNGIPLEDFKRETGKDQFTIIEKLFPTDDKILEMIRNKLGIQFQLDELWNTSGTPNVKTST